MPIFGTSETITSLEQLQTLAPETRLSVQKKDNKDVLVATKGTLSDGLYSFWAYWCPNQAQQARKKTLNHSKELISNFYGREASLVFKEKFDSDSSTSPFTISAFSAFNVVLAESVRKKLADQCPDKDLAEALVDNQFTEQKQPAFIEKQESTQFIKRINKEFVQGNNSAIFSRLKILSTGLYNDEAALDKFKNLGQMILNFREKIQKLKELTSGERVENSPMQAFNRNVKNFLDNHPQISEENLEKYLDNYNKKYSQDHENTSDRTAAGIEHSNEVQANLKDIRNDELTKTILSFPELSTRIINIRDKSNYEDFFNLLKELATPESKFKDSKGQWVSLGKDNITFFNQLLKAFSISSTHFPAYTFFGELAEFLPALPQNISQLTERQKSKAYNLSGKVWKILESNKKDEDSVKKASSTIKQKVLDHQAEEKKYQESWKDYQEKIKEDPTTQPPTMKKPTMTHAPDQDAVNAPLLSPEAKRLLAFTILSLTAPEKRETISTQLTEKFGITF